MTVSVEQRNEQRLYRDWPIWFTEGYGKSLYCGKMLAISSTATSFSCYLTRKSLSSDKQITIYLDVPHFSLDDYSDIVSFTQVGRICRIDTIGRNFCRIVVRFDEPLPFKPSKLEALNRSFAVAV
jgi:hypothetical protein